MSGRRWLIRDREFWHLLPVGAKPDPDAWCDETRCGMYVACRNESRQGGNPDCPYCAGGTLDPKSLRAVA